VDHLRQLVGKNLLGLIELAALPLVHLIDLLKRQEGQHTDALHDVGIVDVAPVLIEVKGAGLVRIEPDGVARGLTHLFALRIGQERDGHGMRVLSKLAANEFRTTQHV